MQAVSGQEEGPEGIVGRRPGARPPGNAADLVKKLRFTPSYVTDAITATGIVPAEVMAACAKNAFLLNLMGHLGIDPDGGPEVGERAEGAVALTEHLLGILAEHKKLVPERHIKRAHCDMVLPATRALISSCLFGEGVACTSLGVPKKYGAA